MTKDKLLVIGGGIGQRPIIEKAKKRGVHTSVVTLPGKESVVDLVDDVFYCDIYKRDEIVEWARINNITAVVSDQNDLVIPTVAYVAEKLGLPGNKFEQVSAYCNKNVYRENCDKLGVPTTKHTAVNSANCDFRDFHCPFPWIVKPADSQSSVGVKKVNSKGELKEALEKALNYSKTHSAIVEEFFTGKEIVCEGFIENGKYYLLSFGDRKYFNLENLFIPSQTIFPSIIKQDLLDRIVGYEQRMARYINPSFAIVHSEYLVDEEKEEIRVIESALRGGGVYISSHLIPLATGIDINDVLLSKALGKEVDVESIFAQKQNGSSAYVCFYLPQGKVLKTNGVDELKSLPFVKGVYLDDVAAGSQTEPMRHKGMRKGPILVKGKDRSEVNSHIETIRKTLNIQVETPDGDKGIIWD